jgi:diadenosine tetraphosphatase ApaH/serine/threonine PP2A family protein phosphatase
VGRTLLVGDVHSCSAELAELLDQVGPDRVVLVGDVFNKGPDPDGVWALVQQWSAEAVRGNHDQKVIDRPVHKGVQKAPTAAVAWLDTLPLFLQGDGWLAVHGGLHPTLGPAGTTPSMAMNLRRWPDDTDRGAPFWWEVYQGPGLVVYGHDAVRGLVDRRPQTLGLDTGCCYGGRLTGWIAEEDRLVSVPAHKAWRPW